MPELPLGRDPRSCPCLRNRHMIITVSGSHGTGKSTYAARIAQALRLRHVSAGVLFRRIAREKSLSLEVLGSRALENSSIDEVVDERTVKEAEEGNVVVDGQLAGWVLKDRADLRIFLTAPEPVRLERIGPAREVSSPLRIPCRGQVDLSSNPRHKPRVHRGHRAGPHRCSTNGEESEETWAESDETLNEKFPSTALLGRDHRDAHHRSRTRLRQTQRSRGRTQMHHRRRDRQELRPHHWTEEGLRSPAS